MKMIVEHTKKQIASISTVSLLTQVIKWAKVYTFVVDREYVLDIEENEVKSKRGLQDTDTMIMCMHLYIRHVQGGDGHTIGSLAGLMGGSTYNSRKAREGKIRRVLKVISSYQVVDFYRDQDKGNRDCIRVEATDLLVDFIENNFFKLNSKEQTKQQTVNSAESLLSQIRKWSEVYEFILDREQVSEIEAKSKRSLIDNDMMIMCMILYVRHRVGGELYTVGSLADMIDGNSYNAKKAREGKIKRSLKAISSYQIVDSYRAQHKGKRKCTRIQVTPLLVDFIENNFFSLDKRDNL